MIASEDQAHAFVAERCGAVELAKLERLAHLLREENQRQNLVASSSLEHIWRRHIADSAQLLAHAPNPADGTWLDLGTGAGFPGIVIAIMRPEIDIVLVESRRLRFTWLAHLAEELSLPHCRVEGIRLESLPTIPCSVISARAFAPLGKLVALARRFSTSDTTWLLPKGRSAAQEVADLPKDLRAMFHVEQSVTDSEAGVVVGRLAKAAQ